MIAGRRLRETEMAAFDHRLRAKHNVNLRRASSIPPVLTWPFLRFGRPGIPCLGPADTSHTNFCDGAEALEAIRERPSPTRTHAFSGRGYYERGDPHPAGDGWRTPRKRRGIPEPSRGYAESARHPEPKRLGLH